MPPIHASSTGRRIFYLLGNVDLPGMHEEPKPEMRRIPRDSLLVSIIVLCTNWQNRFYNR